MAPHRTATETGRIRRRDLFKAAGAGALVLAFRWPGREAQAAAAGAVAELRPNAWLRIASDGTVTVAIAEAEMGQGISTALPMLVAEHLDADWTKVKYELAPADLAFGEQMTGGSTSVRTGWDTLAHAGGAARQMLVAAAAATWSVAVASCTTDAGFVVHAASKRKLAYGALVAKAAKLPAPAAAAVRLREGPPRLLGKPTRRLDTASKVDGSAVFGLDVAVPGACVARVLQPPVLGATLVRFDAARARAMAGVIDVFAIGSGVAVVAEGFWQASRAVAALDVQWDAGPNASTSSASIRAEFVAATRPEIEAAVAKEIGDVDRALGAASPSKKLEALYEVPFLAHAPMEPMNCTAHVHDGVCEVWAPTQGASGARREAARVTGFPLDAVHVHPTLLGGGFGRRAEQDFVIAAVEIAKRIARPVKLVWTREDDLAHGSFRPAAVVRLEGAVDGHGVPVAWCERIVSPSIVARLNPRARATDREVDRFAVEGSADMPYAVPNLRVEYVRRDTPLRPWFWRSVGHSFNAFLVEGFLDELAELGGKDPVEVRRALLDAAAPATEAARVRAVLDRAAHEAGWGSRLARPSGRGVAVHTSFGSHVAQVVEVTVARDKTVRIDRVVCAVDCGRVVNPDTLVAQIEGGVTFAATAAIYGEITLSGGRVAETNFHKYRMLRMHQAPKIEVHLVVSDAAPGGAGEIAVPPFAPALTNAIFAATGERVRRLPITAAGFRPV